MNSIAGAQILLVKTRSEYANTNYTHFASFHKLLSKLTPQVVAQAKCTDHTKKLS